MADVWFEVANAAGTGPDFYCTCDVTADMWERVLLVKMSLRHIKNDRLRVGSSFWYKNYREEHITVNIVQIVFDWAVRAQLGPEDFFSQSEPEDGRGAAAHGVHGGDYRPQVRGALRSGPHAVWNALMKGGWSDHSTSGRRVSVHGYARSEVAVGAVGTDLSGRFDAGV